MQLFFGKTKLNELKEKSLALCNSIRNRSIETFVPTYHISILINHSQIIINTWSFWFHITSNEYDLFGWFITKLLAHKKMKAKVKKWTPFRYNCLSNNANIGTLTDNKLSHTTKYILCILFHFERGAPLGLWSTVWTTYNNIKDYKHVPIHSEWEWKRRRKERTQKEWIIINELIARQC